MSQHTSYSTASRHLNANDLRFAIVTARFNSQITQALEDGARQELLRLGASPDSIRVVQVAGAFEIPVVAQKLLQTGTDGVVAIGAVIRGETTHYESVCNAVERGCMQAALETGKPIGFGIIMTENIEQARERAGGKHGNKGAEAAQAAVEVAQILRTIK